MPRVVWAEEPNTDLGFEIRPSYDDVPTTSQCATAWQSKGESYSESSGHFPFALHLEVAAYQRFFVDSIINLPFPISGPALNSFIGKNGWIISRCNQIWVHRIDMVSLQGNLHPFNSFNCPWIKLVSWNCKKLDGTGPSMKWVERTVRALNSIRRENGMLCLKSFLCYHEQTLVR